LDVNNINLRVLENTQIGIIILMMLIYCGAVIIGVFDLFKETIPKIFKILNKKKKKLEK
jgi:hypothetical protein